MSYVDKLETELLDKCEDIPFENSLYQDEAFILNTSYTDARAVRNIGLRLSAKVRALRELEFSMEKMTVDLEEIEAKKQWVTDTFALKRLDIERREKLAGIAHTKKLTKDALYECEYLRAILAKLPKLSRSEFEAQEKQYFIESLTRQAIGLPESVKSLEAMGEEIKREYTLERKPTLSERLGVSALQALEGIKTPTNLLGDK